MRNPSFLLSQRCPIPTSLPEKHVSGGSGRAEQRTVMSGTEQMADPFALL